MTHAHWTDEQLSAFLDGELSPVDTDALARDMDADPQLAARAERLSVANTAFVESAAMIDAVPVSAKLKAAMETAPAASKSADNVIAFRPRSVRAFLVEHRAIAASLLCAVTVWGAASSMAPQTASDPFAPGPGGVIVASAPLYQILETAHTGEARPVSGGVTATPQLTFASADGQFCRQVALSSSGSSSAAILCRDEDGWRPQVVAFGLPKGAVDYQTASADRSPALEAFLDARMSGAPMTADEEARLLTSSWKLAGQ